MEKLEKERKEKDETTGGSACDINLALPVPASCQLSADHHRRGAFSHCGDEEIGTEVTQNRKIMSGRQTSEFHADWLKVSEDIDNDNYDVKQ